jgi:hypothetical protein
MVSSTAAEWPSPAPITTGRATPTRPASLGGSAAEPSMMTSIEPLGGDPAPSDSMPPTPPAPAAWSPAGSGGAPLTLLLLALTAAFAALVVPRARRLFVAGAVTPRFALVSLAERPG